MKPRILELVESSGPVAPRFRYSIEVTIEIDEEGGALRVRFRGPPRDVDRDDRITSDRVEEILDEIGDLEPIAGDLVGALRSRVGVSFNHLRAVSADGAELRLDYLIRQLDDPENAARKKAVEVMRRIAAVR
jgi:hypothetical protein